MRGEALALVRPARGVARRRVAALILPSLLLARRRKAPPPRGVLRVPPRVPLRPRAYCSVASSSSPRVGAVRSAYWRPGCTARASTRMRLPCAASSAARASAAAAALPSASAASAALAAASALAAAAAAGFAAASQRRFHRSFAPCVCSSARDTHAPQMAVSPSAPACASQKTPAHTSHT